MKRSLLTLLLSLSILSCFGQSASPFRQFFFNPYLFNPAYTGISGAPDLYLVYRKQWMNVNDAPTTMGVNFQYPTKKRVALGFSVISDEVVALRNTSVMGTFAYVLPIADAQTLRFGLSGGVGFNDLNLEEGEYDPTDPVIINASQNNYYVDGNFGVIYTNHGLRLGFALTQLFEGNRFTPSEFGDVSFSTLDNRLYSASYKFPIGGSGIQIEPYFLYRQRADKQNSWEAASIVHVKEKAWAGASYHETNGFAFFFGLNVKDFFRFSYDYELPPVDKNFISTSSHELHLAFRVGKKREPPVAKKSKKPPVVTEQDSTAVAKVDQPEEKKDEPQELPIEEPVQNDAANNNLVDNQAAKAIVPAVVVAKTVDEKTDRSRSDTGVSSVQNNPTQNHNQEQVTPETNEPVKAKNTSSPPRSFSLAAGHYVVAGAFRIMENAMSYSQNLVGKGYAATVAINPKNELYYVYIFATYDIDEARRVRNQYRLRRPFSEVWLFTME